MEHREKNLTINYAKPMRLKIDKRTLEGNKAVEVLSKILIRTSLSKSVKIRAYITVLYASDRWNFGKANV